MKKREIAHVLGWRKGDERDVFHGRPTRLLDGELVPDERPATYWVREDGPRHGWLWARDAMSKDEFAEALRWANSSLASQQAVAPYSFLPGHEIAGEKV